MSSVPENRVSKRRVFYIPGFDPIHPRRYRELYRKESAEQASVSGYKITLSPADPGARYGWHVDAQVGDARVASDFEVLLWSDIVKESMAQGVGATYLQLCRTAWTYIASGALIRLMQLRKGPIIAALYPIAFLSIQLLLAILFGAILVWGGKMILIPVLGGFGHVISLVMGASAAYALLLWFKARDNKLFAYYLMHDYAYSASLNGAYSSELEARIAEFTEVIATALTCDADEVLVVGHSSGAHLGVSIMADLIRKGKVPSEGPSLSFLTLGQVVPMVSFLRDAHRIRADLNFLSARTELTWVDVSAPGDGCAFALCDPVAVSGVAPETQRWPLVISCAFTKTLSPERWKSLRWRFFRLHFQYLCAFDCPSDYDYFLITAGPMKLGARFANRRPSPSRIVKPSSKFTSLSP